MIGRTAADEPVSRIRDNGVPPGVSYFSGYDTLVLGRRVMFEKDVFDAPETACGKGCDFSWPWGKLVLKLSVYLCSIPLDIFVQKTEGLKVLDEKRRLNMMSLST